MNSSRSCVWHAPIGRRHRRLLGRDPARIAFVSPSFQRSDTSFEFFDLTGWHRSSRVLQTQPASYVRATRRLDPHAIAEHPAKTPQTERARCRLGSFTLDERLLCRTGTVFLATSPRLGLPILDEVKPPTGEPDAGDPHVRFGGRGGKALPTPIPAHVGGPAFSRIAI